MKRSLSIVLFLLICLLSLIDEVHALPWPPTISVYSISFNYESGYTYDALRIKKNSGTYVSVPEWLTGNRNEKIAYIKSQANRKVKAQFYIEPSGYSNSNISVYAEVSGEGIGWINSNTVYFQGSQYSTPKIMTCQGSVPGSVNKKSFSWNWYADAVNGNYLEEPLWIGVTGAHVYYILLAAPQSPMAEPWISVLDSACVWASGKTSLSGALQSLTEELYDCGVEYDGGEHYTKNPSYTNLNLTSLLNDLSNPSNVYMDCRDFSNFLQVLLNSLGGYCNYNRIDRTTYPYGFYYNYLWPAGWGNKSFNNWWNYHQVRWLDSKVADAATKIDNDSNPRSSPHSWKLAFGDMTQSAYIEKLTSDADVTSVATGTCTVY